MTEQLSELWPIAAYFLILVGLLAVMMVLSYVLGPQSKKPAKNLPYESGIVSVNDNKTRFTNHFFLYAIFFVIFDLETIFLFAWVIAFKESGWPGFIEASIFIFILLVALVYLWRIGAFKLKRRHQSFDNEATSHLSSAEGDN